MKKAFFLCLFFICGKLFSLHNEKIDSIKVIAPNVITPNGDGINDTWSTIIVDAKQVFNLQTTIYNRYGKRVFESTNIKQVWNGYCQYEGTLCSDGAYFYVISYLDANTNETKNMSGFIELLSK